MISLLISSVLVKFRVVPVTTLVIVNLTFLVPLNPLQSHSDSGPKKPVPSTGAILQ